MRLAKRRPNDAVALLVLGFASLLAGSLYGWSALIPALNERYGATYAQSAQVFSTAIVSFTLAVLITPHTPRRWRTGRGMSLAIAFGSFCLVAAVLSPWLLGFLIAYGCGFGAVAGLTYIIALEYAARSARSSLMVPAMVAVFGLGGAIFGALMATLVGRGWGTMALMPLIVVSIVVAPILPLVRSQISAGRAPVAGILHLKPAREFLVGIWWIFALGSASGLAVIGLASQFVVDRGADTAMIGFVIAGVALGNASGRIGVGLGAQHLSAMKMVIMSQVLVAGALLGLLCTHDPSGTGAFLALIAIGYGILASAVPNAVRSRIGADGFAVGYSIVFTGWGVAGLLAPSISGAIRDQTGTLDIAAVGALGTSTIAIVLALILWKRLGLPR